MDHVTVIHGIHQRLTDPGWTQDLKSDLALGYDRIVVETEKYPASVFPAWNVYVKNPRYARFHANSIAGFSAAYGGARCSAFDMLCEDRLRTLRIHLVAHSNGTDIALKTVKRLSKMGVHVDTLILVSAAVHSDILKSGLHDLVSNGHLGKVVAYCNDDDVVIRGLQWFPGSYGSLGSRGLCRGKEATGLQVEGYQELESWGDSKHRYVTRWFRGLGHSGVLRAENYEATFACFERDMGLTV